LLDDLLSTDHLNEFDEVSSLTRNNHRVIICFKDNILHYADEIFDATEEFLFDHIDPVDVDMYDSDYFGLLYFIKPKMIYIKMGTW